MSSVSHQPAVRTVGTVLVRALLAVLGVLLLLVLLAAWTPQLLDPLLLRLGI